MVVLYPHTTRVSSTWQKSRRPPPGRTKPSTKPYFSSNFFVFSTAFSTTLVYLSRTADMMVSRRSRTSLSILGYLYKMADRSYAPMTQGPFPSSANCPLRNYRGISSVRVYPVGCIDPFSIRRLDAPLILVAETAEMSNSFRTQDIVMGCIIMRNSVLLL